MAKTLVEILEENNIELVPSSGGLIKARCPFHEHDDSPSFTIYPTGTYYCFGCEKWGDALKFLIEFKDWTNKEAMEYLGEDYKIPKVDKNKVIKVSNTSKTWPFLYDVAEQYHQFLLKTPGAISYFHGRGLTDETISKYKLGYTDGNVLSFQMAEDYILGIEIGLITKDGRECLSHRVTIPNLLDRKQADFLIGRTVTNDSVKYLGVRLVKPVMGFYELRYSNNLMIVEGQLDGLLLRQWGYPAVVLGGTHLTKYNCLLFEGKRVIIVPDNDPPGMKAANSLKDAFGDRAMILDYSELGVKDVSELANFPGAKDLFDSIVKEQISNWTTHLSKDDLMPF
jgi:DNA primase